MSCWRFGAGLALLAAGCQGEYPIAPTICDEWCHVTKGFSCEFYDPAACVSDCEEQYFTEGAACRAPIEVALVCFRATPGVIELYCSPGFGAQSCRSELDALFSCANALPRSG